MLELDTMAGSRHSGEAPSAADLAAWLRRLPAASATVVAAAREASRQTRQPVYLVGGPVRDLALDRPLRDLDLVVEGDGLAFAERLAAILGGRVERRHPEFLTAAVGLAGGSTVDVASTRRETYPAPAALPQVVAASLADDLRRRDFAVNTLTLRLGPEDSPRWIDPLGGWGDLQRRSLRVLHDASFVDDPTRVLRAVRFEARLGFRLEPHSERLARRVIREGGFDALSGSRLWGELLRLLAEPEIVPAALHRWADLGGAAVLDRDLRWEEEDAAATAARIETWKRWRQAGRTELPPDPSRLLLAGWISAAGPEVSRRVAGRLGLSGADRDLVVGAARRHAAAVLSEAPVPHLLAAALDPLAAEERVLLAAAGFEPQIEHFLDELAGFRLTIGGSDLRAAGIPPGPALGAALARTRAARLDGEIARDEELRYALERARGRGDR